MNEPSSTSSIAHIRVLGNIKILFSYGFWVPSLRTWARHYFWTFSSNGFRMAFLDGGMVAVVPWAQPNLQSPGSRCGSTSQKCCSIFCSILKWVCEAGRKGLSHLFSHGWALGSLSKSCLWAVAFEVPSSCQAITSREMTFFPFYTVLASSAQK